MPLVQRDDDNEETIKERFEEYKMKTAPLHDYYKNANTNYIEVTVTDSEIEATSVNEEIMGKLSELGLVQK